MSENNLKNNSETNWDYLKMATDEEIDTSDIPPFDNDFFAEAKMRLPEGKVSVLLNLDEEVVGWYQKQGKEFQNLINTALRDYAETNR